jgi:CHASE3 domain sensor protein
MADELPRFTRRLEPLINLIARIPANIHTKLLAGFIGGTLLLLLLAAMNEVVIGRMSERVSELTVLQDRLDRARQMQYDVTAQSHYRAMALLTNDNSNNDKIAQAKQSFLDNLDALERAGDPSLRGDLE